MSSARKLVVEVVDAKDLLPKDGHGTSSPYAILDFYGQRKRTQTAIRDLSPTWNEVLEFNVGRQSNVFGDMLELDVYHDKNFGPTRRSNFLGRFRLNSRQFVKKGEEALIYYPLEKKHLFSWVQGEIGLKIYFSDEVAPPPPREDSAAAPPPAVVPDAEVKDVPVEKSETPPESAPVMAPEPPADATPETSAEPPEESSQAPAAEAAPPTTEGEERMEDASYDPVKPVRAEPVTQPEPSIRVDAFRDTRSMSEVNIGGFNGPKPIPRSASVSSFISEAESIPIERSSFDLVNKMHYLFIRVVWARSLPTNGSPVTKIAVSGYEVRSKPARKTQFYEWDQTFAFSREAPDSSPILEVSVWEDVAGHDFLGGICFDVTEIPLRDPPDSPLAPQWYRLEGGGAHNGDLMLATWVGTQADDSFPDSWKTDIAGNPNSRSKIYQSPKMWYLRVTVLEGQDVLPLAMPKESSFQIRAQLGFQVLRTKPAISRNGSSSWNEDLLFVASEPFTNHRLMLYLENRQVKEPLRLGVATIPLISIERRVDDRQVAARWMSFEDLKDEKVVYKGRVHVRVCFDGGYHVMDEAANLCSDYRPTARQLWKPPIGTIELGIVGCKNLLPMKTIDGKGSTDAYVVAKYGNKWVRTRTISDCLDPKWNEQYTWRVYDPSTVLTVGVFDSWEVFEINSPKEPTRPDFRVGKVRVRVSTLKVGKVYRSTYPLIMLTPIGLKKMGEIELAVRFVCTSAMMDLIQVYSQPILPLMHHIKPLGMVQQELLRAATVKIMASHLARSEPPLPREVVSCMLDAETHTFSMRKVRANWMRIVNVVAGVMDMVKWVEDTRSWKKPTATLLVHALLVLLVWYPDLIIPTLAFYVFTVGAWNYRFRSREPLPHFDPKISLAESIDRDELDEEFDTMPSNRQNEVVRARYDKLRGVGARVQTILGDLAALGERLQALVMWRDPRATGIFVGLCFVVALILYLVPSKMIAMAFGFYYLRHPIFRDRMPSPVLNFFRRLPSLSERLM